MSKWVGLRIACSLPCHTSKQSIHQEGRQGGARRLSATVRQLVSPPFCISLRRPQFIYTSIETPIRTHSHTCGSSGAHASPNTALLCPATSAPSPCCSVAASAPLASSYTRTHASLPAVASSRGSLGLVVTTAALRSAMQLIWLPGSTRRPSTRPVLACSATIVSFYDQEGEVSGGTPSWSHQTILHTAPASCFLTDGVEDNLHPHHTLHTEVSKQASRRYTPAPAVPHSGWKCQAGRSCR